MRLNELRDRDGATKSRLRVGRGAGSGKGKTAGRGNKGQKSRSGVAIKGFEGGQMPIYRRLPKRGFSSRSTAEFGVVNLGRIQKAIDEGRIDAASPIDGKVLEGSGLVRARRDGVRLLASGELKSKIIIHVDHASVAATSAVENSGGSVNLVKVKAQSGVSGASKAKDPASTKASK